MLHAKTLRSMGRLLGLLIPLMLQSLCSSQADARTGTMFLRSGTQKTPPFSHSLDLDGDGWSELVVIGEATVFVYEHGDWLGRVCTYQHSLFVDAVAHHPGCLDVTASGTREIVLALLRDEESFLQAYSSDLEAVWTSDPIPEFYLEGGGAKSPAIQPMGIIARTGRRLLIYVTNTGYRKTPREVGAFDIETGHRVWSVPIGAIPISLALEDMLGNDGIPEILVGTHAANNGVKVRGTDDAHSHALLLGADGQVLWEHKVGGVFSKVEVKSEDLDGNGRLDICVLKVPGNDPAAQLEIQARDVQTGLVRRFKPLPGGRPGGWDMVDFNRDGVKEFIVGLSTGEILLIDGKTYESKSVEVDSSPIRDMHVTDLEGDGSAEVVCSTSNSIAVIDRELNVMARGTFPGGKLLIKGEGGGRHSIYVREPSGYIAAAEILPSRGVQLPSGLWLLIPVVLAVWTLLLLRRAWLSRRYAGQERLWDRLHLEMQDLRHGESSRNALTELERWLREAFSDTADGLSKARKQVPDLTKEFLRSSGVQARRAFELAGRLGLGAGDNKDLTPRRASKTLSELDALTAEDVTPQVLEQGKKDVNVIRSALTHIEGALINHFSVDLIEETHKALRRVFAERPGSSEESAVRGHGGLSASIRLDPGSFPAVFARSVDLQSVLVNVFDNAARAMEGAKNPRIEIKVTSTPVHTTMLISDTGCGIADDHWEKVFEAGVSSKDGDHGQGLTICRQRLAQFRGTLKVLKSTAGEGTTMEIRLRTVSDE